MELWAVAAIVFICMAVNHLGLISAIERAIRHNLPIINCPKCFTCWSITAYLITNGCDPLLAFATALLGSYLALWLELIMYAIDSLFNRIYGKIEDYNQKDDRR